MEATIGFISTSTVLSAKPVSFLTSTSISGRLTSATADLRKLQCSQLSLKLSSIHHSLQCKRQINLRKGSVEATNLNEISSPPEYTAPLSEDLNSAPRITHNSTSLAKSASANKVLPFNSGSVELEALHSTHAAKLKRASELSPNIVERVRRDMIPLHQLRHGGFAENSFMYRQLFVIRSYEVGADKCMSVREIFSLFQEMALNHVELLGIAGDGFGATRAMNRLGLIWVVTKLQVDVERYPAWPEVIEIDSWIAWAGKNGLRRDWIMRSYQTGEVLARATSTWCMMNGTTRRLAKIPNEVRSEFEPNFMDNRFVFSQDECIAPRISKLDDVSAHHQRSELTSSPADLDMNQHVNNLKYINWVLESVPVEHIKTHKLASIVLEYRRECHSTDIVESLTGSQTNIDGQGSDSIKKNDVELAMDRTAARGSCCQYTHLLRTQDAGQQEILRGKTTWRSRSVDENAEEL